MPGKDLATTKARGKQEQRLNTAQLVGEVLTHNSYLVTVIVAEILARVMDRVALATNIARPGIQQF